ncbi:MAG: hypothetical protein U9Q69_01760 [Nanoarchaeota archaeon]|nr:hypothetical protein [Nanoarchaeota archaeon]
MIISFFEEFPSEKNLEKIRLVDFPTKLYIASKSLKNFKKIKITSKFVKEVVYWPVLDFNEGYWMSPFSKRKALKKVIDETENLNILWDAEWPKKRSLVLLNAFQFFGNRKLIKRFFKKHKGTIYTAEYFPEKGFFAKLLVFFGLSFDPNKYGSKMIKMIYSSMHDYGKNFIKKEVEFGVKNYGNNFLVALGTIAVGIKGDEDILDLKVLERDLGICKKAGVNEVIVFRLGGLDKDYLKIIKKIESS